MPKSKGRATYEKPVKNQINLDFELSS